MVLKTNGNGNVCRASTRKRNVSIGFLGKIDMSKGFLSIRNIFMDPCNNINRLIGPPPSKWMCIRILFVIKVFTNTQAIKIDKIIHINIGLKHI